ncbi:MAG TPA: hypothetical protein VL172_21350 [Kofleriaceae bacterium]|nr:hypothetical protein [Kofleriaceae bacterium]
MRAAVLLACTALALAPACGKKRTEKGAPALPALDGLAAVPASATVVIGIDVPALAGSELVRRAVQAMFERDPELRRRLDRLTAACQIDPARDLRTLTIGMGAEPEQVVLVAAGNFEEAALSTCLNRYMAESGGSLTTVTVGDRVFYLTHGTDGDVYLTMGGAGTLALSPSRAWLEEAVGGGPKASTHPVLADAIGRIRDGRTLWAAGMVPEKVGKGMIDATHGQIEERPRVFFGDLRLDDGVQARLGAIMASPEDAKTLETKAVFELALGSLVAQEWGLGPLIARTRAHADGQILEIELGLTPVEVNEVLTALGTAAVDTGPAPDKNAAPLDAGKQE